MFFKKKSVHLILQGLMLASVIFCSSTNTLFAYERDDISRECTFQLLTGVYSLEGSNPNSNKINYRGEVTIKKYGSNYFIIWKIGKKQRQTGIGILEGNVLSVAFCDLSGKVMGVVSYSLVGNGKIEGSWANYGSVNFGKEYLSFKHD